MAKKSMLTKGMTISEMQAIEMRYGSVLTVGKIFVVIFAYSLSSVVLSYLMYFSVWISLFYFILACFFSYFFILPKSIEANYFRKAFFQRNKAINLMCQRFAGKRGSTKDILRSTKEKLKGELRKDMSELLVSILDDGSKKNVHSSFENFKSKYIEDVYFVQFMTQVELSVYNSDYNLEALTIIKNSHNFNYRAQQKYINKRNLAKNELIVLYVVIFLIFFALTTNSDSTTGWLNVYATPMVGRIISTIYMSLQFFIIYYFLNHFYDESVVKL